MSIVSSFASSSSNNPPAFASRFKPLSAPLPQYSLSSSIAVSRPCRPRAPHPSSTAASAMSVLPTVSLSAMIAGLRQRLDRHLPSKRQLDDYGLESDSFPDWFGTRLPPSLAILDLRSAAVSDVIPFSLERAAGLSVLSLAGNSLTGDILATLSGLRHLTHLNLSRNALSGSVPPALAALSNLPPRPLCLLSPRLPLRVRHR